MGANFSVVGASMRMSGFYLTLRVRESENKQTLYLKGYPNLSIVSAGSGSSLEETCRAEDVLLFSGSRREDYYTHAFHVCSEILLLRTSRWACDCPEWHSPVEPYGNVRKLPLVSIYQNQGGACSHDRSTRNSGSVSVRFVFEKLTQVMKDQFTLRLLETKTQDNESTCITKSRSHSNS